MQLGADWKAVLTKAWSVRLFALSVMCDVLGIVFAVGFWVLQTMFVRLAGAFRLDYRIAYAIPPFALLGISWLLFRRRSR